MSRHNRQQRKRMRTHRRRILLEVAKRSAAAVSSLENGGDPMSRNVTGRSSVRALRNLMLLVVALLFATATANAATPEQDVQAARRRMAEVCQNLVMSGLVTTCTVEGMLPRGVR